MSSENNLMPFNTCMTADSDKLCRTTEAIGDFFDNSQATNKETLKMIEEEIERDENIIQQCLPVLYKIREPVAEYQSKKGISKTESCTFYNLIYTVGQYLYNSLTAMAYMLFNLVPILDAFLLIARFTIDRLIEILEADDSDRYMKAVILFVEFIPIFFILAFIYGFIVVPLTSLFLTVLQKVWLFVW